MITIEGHINPVIVNFPDQSYLVSGNNWVKVSQIITLDDIKWEDLSPKIKEVEGHNKVSKVLSSDGTKYYTVTQQGIHFSCTCLGYEWRRTCRHIDETKEKL